jgi:L-seryl-tRNA(Ser) seleniumtransferase
MVEVGTTNRTTVGDFSSALTEQTRVLLTSHPSNYRIVGFTAAPDPRELAALAAGHGLVLVQDLGSGSPCRLEQLGRGEPSVRDCLAQGADIVTFSGDKLLGGPQAGIVVGRAALIERLRRHPLARAMRIDKLSLAGLEGTLRLYQSPNDPFERVPVLRMIGTSKASIARRAARVAKRLDALEGVSASLADGVSYAGGGALPMSELETRVIRLEVDGASAVEVARKLRAAAPPVVGRIVRDAVTLDLRTVLPHQARELVAAIGHALS